MRTAEIKTQTKSTLHSSVSGVQNCTSSPPVQSLCSQPLLRLKLHTTFQRPFPAIRPIRFPRRLRPSALIGPTPLSGESERAETSPGYVETAGFPIVLGRLLWARSDGEERVLRRPGSKDFKFQLRPLQRLSARTGRGFEALRSKRSFPLAPGSLAGAGLSGGFADALRLLSPLPQCGILSEVVESERP